MADGEAPAGGKRDGGLGRHRDEVILEKAARHRPEDRGLVFAATLGTDATIGAAGSPNARPFSRAPRYPASASSSGIAADQVAVAASRLNAANGRKQAITSALDEESPGRRRERRPDDHVHADASAREVPREATHDGDRVVGPVSRPRIGVGAEWNGDRCAGGCVDDAHDGVFAWPGKHMKAALDGAEQRTATAVVGVLAEYFDPAWYPPGARGVGGSEQRGVALGDLREMARGDVGRVARQAGRGESLGPTRSWLDVAISEATRHLDNVAPIREIDDSGAHSDGAKPDAATDCERHGERQFELAPR